MVCECRIWGNGDNVNKQCSRKSIEGQKVCKLHINKIKERNGEPIYFTINENFEDCSQKFIENMEAVENNNLQYITGQSN